MNITLNERLQVMRYSKSVDGIFCDGLKCSDFLRFLGCLSLWVDFF